MPQDPTFDFLDFPMADALGKQFAVCPTLHVCSEPPSLIISLSDSWGISQCHQNPDKRHRAFCQHLAWTINARIQKGERRSFAFWTPSMSDPFISQNWLWVNHPQTPHVNTPILIVQQLSKPFFLTPKHTNKESLSVAPSAWLRQNDHRASAKSNPTWRVNKLTWNPLCFFEIRHQTQTYVLYGVVCFCSSK